MARATAIPKVVVRQLWQLTRREPRKAYTARRASPTIIEVLEQGSKVLHRAKVKANDNAEYVIERGWLVERTFPAALQRHADETAAAKRATAAARSSSAAATRDPVFQMYLRELTRVLGKPRNVRKCQVSMWSFAPFESDADFLLWQTRARAAGGALTNCTDHTGSSVRLVSGPVSRLGALFGESYWYGSKLDVVLAALDADATLFIDFVEDEGECFQLALSRRPRDVSRHATALGKVFGTRPAVIAKALRARLWRYGSVDT